MKQVAVWDGERITEPGVYKDVPIEVYHSQDICAGPSVSSSNLRRVLEQNGGSPAHFYDEWSGNTEREDKDESKALILGRAVHHLLFGMPDFRKYFELRPDELEDKHGIIKPWQGNRTECRAWLEARAKRGITVFTGQDVVDIVGMTNRLKDHDLIKKGILSGSVERSFFWRDKKTGLWLKSRPDAVPTDSGDFCDLKTTRSTRWFTLRRTIEEYAYHQQAALIIEGAKACTGIEASTFTFLFVESKRPWCVRPVMLKDGAIATGAMQNRHALDLIAACLKSGNWPGPGENEIFQMDLSDNYIDFASAEADAAKADLERRSA